jgi:hypothetical protein
MAKRDALFLHLIFAGLFIMAFFFSEERLYADAGYYLSRVINGRGFWIEHNRLILFFSQILPWLAVLARLPLKAVIILYSLGHVLYFYLLALIAFYLLRDRYAALALILVQITGISQSYFTPQFEMYYGIGLLILFSALLAKMSSRDLPRSTVNITLLLILGALVITSHPVNQYLFLFVVVWDIIRNKRKIDNLHILLVSLLILGFIYKWFTFSPYEQGKVGLLLHFRAHKHYLQLRNLHYLLGLVIYLIRYYWDAGLLFLITLIVFIKSKEYSRMILILIFTGAYLLVVNITYNGLGSGRYMEQVYFPIVFLVLWPYIDGVLRKPGTVIRAVTLVLMSLILVIRPAGIVKAGHHFSERMAQIKGMVAFSRQMPGDRFYIGHATLNEGTVDFGWSLPVESMLLSAERNSQRAVSVVTQEDMEGAEKIRQPGPGQFIFTRWEVDDNSYLNVRYFKLTPCEYKPLSLTPDALRRYGENLHLSIESKKEYGVNATVIVPVHIRNLNTPPGTALFGCTPLLSYHWYRNGQLYQWDGIRTPVKGSIYNRLKQTVTVQTPPEPGEYVLMVEMLVEGMTWFGDGVSEKVTIR